ncbi:MAG: hypothetical protein ACSLFQ_01105 [Thermoanaerobaculia bacterium]
MTTRNIDDQLRQYYGDAALTPEALGRLRGVLTKTTPAGKSTEKRRATMSVWQTIALAASVSIIFLAGAVLLLRQPQSALPGVAAPGVSERLAEEVARRHGRCIEEIDFRAEDLSRLLAQMQKIDFVSGVPSRRGIDRMKVKGAHYCVLDGQIAIHVVLVDESGGLVSLFETKASASVASLRSASHRMGGTDVDLWRERGVLYAVAVAAPAT